MPIQPVGPHFNEFSDGVGSGYQTPQTPAEPVGYAVITASPSLGLRQEPASDAPRLEDQPFIPQGAMIEVLSEQDENGWAQVRYNGVEGYAKIGGAEDDGTPFSESIPAEDYASFQEAQELYVSQFDAEAEFEDPGSGNANCGPTSLTMAFEREGLTLPEIPGVDNDGSDGSNVQRARFAMYGFNPQEETDAKSEYRDGVTPLPDSQGREPYTEGWEPTYEYADMSLNYAQGGENSQPTGFNGMIRAATDAGGSADYISDPTTDNIAVEIRAGRTVIVSGTTLSTAEGDQAVNTDNDYNNDVFKPEDDILPGLAADTRNHIIAITGVTSDGNFIVCDPANQNRSPVIVTPQQLESFMSGNASAVWIDGPPPLTENLHSGNGNYVFRA